MCVYPKWPDKIFPMVNFGFFHCGHFGRGGGGGEVPGGGGGILRCPWTSGNASFKPIRKKSPECAEWARPTLYMTLSYGLE